MGNAQSRSTAQSLPRIPNLKFRVLVIGRANAGKTTILQRVCETTESPTIYRGNKEVTLNPSMDRGEHCIDDELVFSNHTGYIFHDSQGIEAGDEERLEILKDFIRRKGGEKRLRNKLHAIWYCVPMDDHRPELNLKFFKNICPDQNVPVIAVFTKYDQFRRNVEMDVSDYPDQYPDSNASQVAEKQFQEYYLRPLGDDVNYVRLQKMHMKDSCCDSLVEKTAAALNEDTVGLMLLAVQRSNLELSVKTALTRIHDRARLNGQCNVKQVIRDCLIPFPYLWYWNFFFENFFSSSLGHVMSLSAIQKLVNKGVNNHHLIIAVLLILKHATVLCLSNTQESALSQANLDYKKEKIDLTIQQHLLAYSPEDSVEQFVGFIMVTEIVPSHSSVKASA